MAILKRITTVYIESLLGSNVVVTFYSDINVFSNELHPVNINHNCSVQNIFDNKGKIILYNIKIFSTFS